MASDYEEISARLEMTSRFLRAHPEAVGITTVLVYSDNRIHTETYVKREHTSTLLGMLFMHLNDLSERIRKALGWSETEKAPLISQN